MKNLYRNGIVLFLAICFLAFNFIGAATDAREMRELFVKTPTPTPSKKKSPTPKPTPKITAKATPKPTKTVPKTTPTITQKDKTNSTVRPTPKPTPKLTPKPDAAEQIIVIATASRLRQQPKANAPQVSLVKVGKILPVTEKNAAWYQVEYETGKSGWISKTVVKNFDAASRDDIYREIADKYAKNKSLDFGSAAEVSDFLFTAQALAKKDALKADLGFKRLRILAAAMKAIPFGKGETSPYKQFLKAHDKEVLYSEPSGEWLVRSELFWELHGRFIQQPIAEDIAWAAAKNGIPGECEGYINCRLYVLRAMEGEYLNFYPNGKYTRQALEITAASLGIMVADMNNKDTFTPLADISDRAEFNRFLTELRTIISKVADIDKAKSLQQINRLGEGYK